MKISASWFTIPINKLTHKFLSSVILKHVIQNMPKDISQNTTFFRVLDAIDSKTHN
jgi:hypothetical protein